MGDEEKKLTHRTYDGGDSCGPISRELDTDATIDRYEQYVAQRPSAVAFYNLGLAYFQKGKIDHAGGAFVKALEMNPDMTAAMINLGGIAYQKTDFEACIKFNRNALELEPKSLFAKRNLALGLLMLNDEKMNEEALGLLENVLADEPEDSIALYNMAVLKFTAEDFESAREYLDKAVAAGYEPNPEFVEKLNKAK
jgi:tetratricopeptide (TPR) repeat protein